MFFSFKLSDLECLKHDYKYESNDGSNFHFADDDNDDDYDDGDDDNDQESVFPSNLPSNPL